jgi:predicted nuclease with TOPRIM domain
VEVDELCAFAIIACMKPTIVKEKVTLAAIGQLIERSVSKLATKEELKETVEKAVDDLAGAVKKGFDEVHEKFAKINEKFAKVDEKFAKVDEKFERIEFKIDRMDTRFTNQLDYINVWYPSKFEFTGLDTRVKKIEKRMRIKV